MSPRSKELIHALKSAEEALRTSDRPSARYWARQALTIAPDREEPWLIMASIGSPQASVAYLKRALEINPASRRARQGMHWAVQRLREAEQASTHEPDDSQDIPLDFEEYLSNPPVPQKKSLMKRPWFPLWAGAFVILLSFAIWFGYAPISTALGNTNSFIPNSSELILPTFTPTPTFTFTPTATPTFTPTSTPTFTSTPTSTFTLTPTSTATFTSTPSPTITLSPTYTTTPTLTPTQTLTPSPTFTPYPTITPTPTVPIVPMSVGNNGFWIDVDLTNQRVYVYHNQEFIRDFIMSSGAPGYETKPGQFRIYAKYKSANMDGQGYDVPAVPYVLFYDNDFAFHGAYWHNDFGTPVSHGCVNLKVDDARWLYDWANVGTLVNIHY